MSDVVHDTFTFERSYPVPPARVFAAWSDPAQKRRWFRGPDEWPQGEHSLDFRVGGRERNEGRVPGGGAFRYDAVYHEIVADRRIVLAYTMHSDDVLISVSLSTVQLIAERGGTRLVYTEQGTYLPGGDTPAMRLAGTEQIYGNLERLLRASA